MDGDGNVDNDITVLRIEFSSGSGILSFYWCWLTSEEDEGPEYDYFFLVRLDCDTILSGSVDKLPLHSPFPNVPTDGVFYSVTSTGPTSGSSFNDGRSGFQVCSVPIDSGDHVIEFIVADATDSVVDSGLLIDALDFPEAKTQAAVGGYLMAPSALELLMPLFAICSAILASILGAATLLMRRRA